jgi:ParB family chromosome partitioning protein
VLVQPEADTTIDPMRTVSENLVRAEMGQVDRWRSMEALSAAGWNDEAIAEALGMSPRNIAQARLLANICPAMLDQMANNDLPDQRELRVIAAATKEEQTEVWKRFKPKRGHEASWGEISRSLSKVRLPAKNAKFGDAEAEAFGIHWEEDLFAPADEDSRSTTQVDAFLAAQTAWLEANLAEGDCIIEMDEYYRPKLPRGAQQHYGRAGEGVFTAHYIEGRSGIIRETHYTMPASQTGSSGQAAEEEAVRKPRPDLTAKGAAMVGDLRTDAMTS